MEKILPLFPLGLVVYPSEALNLHIFEPRYRQLIHDCLAKGLTFGIPPYVNDQMMRYGTEVEITRIEKRYEDGRLDIRTQGRQIFRVETFDNPMGDRLYAGGLVQFLENNIQPSRTLEQRLRGLVEQLYHLIQVDIDMAAQYPELNSYTLAHKIGLSLEQEYNLLTILDERDRMEFLIAHLERALPVVEQMERTKQIIRLNGHFKHFDPLNF